MCLVNKLKGRVLGVGGVFFRSPDPGKLAKWYQETLGLATEARQLWEPPENMPEKMSG